jgi:predicted DNA-binding transcriptional regulator YafY
MSLLSLLQDAIWHDQRIQLVYAQDNGQQQRFLVEPYGLVAKASEWYLIGVCADRHNSCNSCSIYSIERILLVEPTAQPFVRPNDFDLTAYWNAYQQRVRQRRQQVQPFHPRSKKTNFVSKKTGNGRSPYKKKSVSLHVSQHRSHTHAFKKSHIKKTPSHSSYFASFSERLNAA